MLIYKFRGLSQEYNHDNMYYKIADYMLGPSDQPWQISEPDLWYNDERRSTCTDYLISNTLNDKTKIIMPSHIIRSLNRFKLNTDDLTVNTLHQHRNRTKKDYAGELLFNSPHQVFLKRYKDHIKRLKKEVDSTPKKQ